MNDKNFQKLVESVEQMGSILQGKNIQHRQTLLTNADIGRVELDQLMEDLADLACIAEPRDEETISMDDMKKQLRAVIILP